MQEKWKILPLYIQNIHKNNDSGLYPDCGYSELEGDAKDHLWLDPGVYSVCVFPVRCMNFCKDTFPGLQIELKK